MFDTHAVSKENDIARQFFEPDHFRVVPGEVIGAVGSDRLFDHVDHDSGADPGGVLRFQVHARRAKIVGDGREIRVRIPVKYLHRNVAGDSFMSSLYESTFVVVQCDSVCAGTFWACLCSRSVPFLFPEEEIE